jgi:hypothetical protein
MPWHSQDEADERQRSIAQLRADFQAMPPEIQEETRGRVQRLLVDEAKRKQGQPSYLRRIARKVYGI